MNEWMNNNMPFIYLASLVLELNQDIILDVTTANK